MLVREFLTQRLAPLQAHSRPLWSFKGAEDDLRLRSDDLSHEELADPLAERLLEKMTAGLEAGKLTGAMIVKEFLTQHLAPLQAHSRPLWSFKGEVDDLWLCPDDLSDEELSKAFCTLLGKN